MVGWDSRCCESEDWMQQAKVEGLKGGPGQTFYHVSTGCDAMVGECKQGYLSGCSSAHIEERSGPRWRA